MSFKVALSADDVIPPQAQQEGHRGTEPLTGTMYTSLVQWKVMI